MKTGTRVLSANLPTPHKEESDNFHCWMANLEFVNGQKANIIRTESYWDCDSARTIESDRGEQTLTDVYWTFFNYHGMDMSLVIEEDSKGNTIAWRFRIDHGTPGEPSTTSYEWNE